MSRGEVIPSDLTLSQVCHLTGAYAPYVRAVARMTDAERELIERGDFKLAPFIKRKTEAQIDRIITK